jgi:mannose-6-phosphate isomerase class I
MATSDNVVRAGLTPKLRDTDILCSMLTYNQVRRTFTLPLLYLYFTFALQSGEEGLLFAS